MMLEGQNPDDGDWGYVQALALFQQALEDGHFNQQRWDASGVQRTEVARPH